MVCHRSFVRTRPDNRLRNERIWFERWLIEGYSIRQLSEQGGLSRSRLYRIIHRWLDCNPPVQTMSLQQPKYLIFDGTWFHKAHPVVALLDAQQHTLLHGAYGVHERHPNELLAFFEPLRHRGLKPCSCTIDGNQHVARALRQIWPQITLQRCLVHVQRQGLSWCRQRPKRLDAAKLRGLFLRLSSVTTIEERDHFLVDVEAWEQRYGGKIAARPERGKVFSDLKRARSMLLAALPDLFHYLKDPNIPRSTNGIEGYFSRMKRRYRNHNGLKKLKNYCEWYFHLVRK